MRVSGDVQALPRCPLDLLDRGGVGAVLQLLALARGGFGGEEGCGLVFSSLPSLSEGKLGGDGGGGGGGAKDVKVDKTVASPARVMLSTPPQQPKTRMKIRVVLPLLALSAKRRADLGKLYDACELLKRVKAVERMF